MVTSSLLFDVEKDIALLLLDKLEHFNISFDRASVIAKFILSHLPNGISDDQLMKLLPTLDDQFVELGGIVHSHLVEYEKQHQQATIDNLRDLIKHKHFDQANTLAKKYFEKRLPISA